MDKNETDEKPHSFILISKNRYTSTEYLFEKSNAGLAVIINISKFNNTEKNGQSKFTVRKNSASDEKKIQEVLQSLGFIVKCCKSEHTISGNVPQQHSNIASGPEDKTQQHQFRNINPSYDTKAGGENGDDTWNGVWSRSKLVDLAKKVNKEPNKYEAFCCVIMSYGGDGYFYDNSWNMVYISDILKIFDAENCPGLLLKPKIFILQLCDKDEGRLQEPGRFAGEVSPEVKEYIARTIPSEADFLLYYCLFSGIHYQQMKKDDDNPCGTSMIEALYDVITRRDRNRKLDFVRALMTVNRRVEDDIDCLCKHFVINDKTQYINGKLPHCQLHLTKNLLFPATES